MAWNAPFDASRDFVVRTRDVPIAGRRYGVGDPFDKGTVDARTLQRLYETRVIAYPDEPHSAVRVDPLLAKGEGKRRKGRATPEELASAEAWANERGVTKKVLLEKAEGLASVRPDMNKKAIALELIRAGRGPT